jgi:hypothetical protein
LKRRPGGKGGVGVWGAAPCGGENGEERGGLGFSDAWTGTAWTQWLRAAPTAVGGARLASVAATREDVGGTSDAGAGG